MWVFAELKNLLTGGLDDGAETVGEKESLGGLSFHAGTGKRGYPLKKTNSYSAA